MLLSILNVRVLRIMIAVMFSGEPIIKIPEGAILLLDTIVHVVDEVVIHIVTVLFFTS